MKNTLEEFKSRLYETENQISELEYKVAEYTQSDKQKEKIIKKKKE